MSRSPLVYRLNHISESFFIKQILRSIPTTVSPFGLFADSVTPTHSLRVCGADKPRKDQLY